MLSFPVKKTEKIDIAKPISTYITNHFNEEEAKRLAPSIESVQRLRNEVAEAVGASESALQTLAKYRAEVMALMDKLPVSETDIPISFTWRDAFFPAKVQSRMSWKFEIACVTYNMAVLESQSGAITDRSSEDGIRKANRHFSRSAALFQGLRGSPILQFLNHQSDADMGEQCLKLGSQLMLAQAQACFYELAHKRDMKPNVLAQLAMCTSDLYREAYNIVMAEAFKNTLGKSWGPRFHLQVACFVAAAHWQQSKLVLQEAESMGEGHGKEIAHLDIAERASIDAISVAGQCGLDDGSARHLCSRVQQRKKEAVEYNNSITLDPVPSGTELPKIVGKSMVSSPADVSDLMDVKPQNYFRTLSSAQAAMEITSFRNKMDEEINEWNKEYMRLDEEALKVLEALGLPGALDATAGSAGIPDSLWARVEKVQVLKLLPKIDEMIEDGQVMNQSLNTSLDELLSTLDKEAEEDRKARADWGQKYLAAESKEVQEKYRTTIEKYKQFLRQAGDADQTQARLRQENADELDLLLRSREGLSETLPTSEGKEDVSSEEKNALRKGLQDLTDLMEERKAATSTMKKKISEEKLRDLAAEAGAGNEASALAKVQEQLEKQHEEVLSTGKKQNAMLDRIKVLNQAFNEKRTTNAQTRARQDALQRINHALNTVDQLMSNLKHGAEFYQDMSDRVSNTRNDVQGFIAAREIDRKDTVRRLTFERSTQGDAQYAAELQKSLEQAPKDKQNKPSTAPVPKMTSTGGDQAQQQPPPPNPYAPPAGMMAPPPGAYSYGPPPAYYGGMPGYYTPYGMPQQAPPPYYPPGGRGGGGGGV